MISVRREMMADGPCVRGNKHRQQVAVQKGFNRNSLFAQLRIKEIRKALAERPLHVDF
jgi:hypothetical protein